MDNLIFGMQNLNISQAGYGIVGYLEYSHYDSSLDLCGADNGIDGWFNKTPGTCWKCAGHPSNAGQGNTFMFHPCDSSGTPKKVLCADGVARYVTIALTHSSSVTYQAGRIYTYNELMYTEGMDGNAIGNHIHFEVADGLKTTKTWQSINGGTMFMMSDQLNPVDVMFIYDGFTNVVNDHGLNFKHCSASEANGIVIDDGNVRLYQNGSRVTVPGIYEIGGSKYCLKNNLQVAHGEKVSIGGMNYRFGNDYKMVKGFVLESGELHCYDLVDGHELMNTERSLSATFNSTYGTLENCLEEE